ncbi:MAG TPA: PSD1 and planctomycete cytochrome C domain-containing protein, partial [Pirellulaceae bacterium]|nr:PSD1 and planctomycete cytochrome C domain-containing protein [Pirellulaceae bacterium]
MPRCFRWAFALPVIFHAASLLAADPLASKFELDPAHAEKMKASAELFTKSVRATLTSKCLKCHGGEKTESGFDLATRESLLKGGEYQDQAIIPGDAKQSYLVKLLQHDDEPKMPEEGDKLSDTEIASISEWINLGAAYDKPLVDKKEDPLAWTKKQLGPESRQHWSLQPLGKFAPPATSDTWARTPIDRFILAKLTEKGLTPNKLADKRTLVRRAYFDLIGLPPTPAEVTAFLQDESPDAYEKVIDRLLANEHFGERWARHWLDVARFAESHGFEQDYDRPHAYVFRDFVIEAFNRDLPFDTFVKWQIAGDEFEPENPLALKATGFLGAGVFPTQITANEVERTRYDAIDDMAATTSTAFLGLTVGCARCHDHKFDPIPQADYYRFAATFVTTVRSNQDINLDPAGFKLQKEAFDREHAPFVAAVAKFEKEQLPARLAAWEKEHGQEVVTAKWQVQDIAESKSSGGATLTKQDDGSLLASGTNPPFDAYTFVVNTKLRDITGVKLEALAHPSFVKGGPGRAGNGNIALTDFRVTAQPADGSAPPVEVKLQNAQATFEQKPSLLVAFAIDGDKKSAWALDPQFGKDHAAVFETAANLGFESGTKLTFTLEFNNNQQHNIGRPRLSLTVAPRPLAIEGGAIAPAIAQALAVSADKRSPEQVATLIKWYAPQDAEWQQLTKVATEHLAKAPQPKLDKLMICSEGVTPIRHHTQGADFFNEFYFSHRGDCNEKRGVAEQGFLQVLTSAPEGVKHWQSPPPAGSHTSYRRRALANWLTDTEYGAGQLLARVIVNRVWQHHVGQGIVSTANDFGKQGTLPAQPELLDYLANDLIANGWQLKRLHKQIMLSSVYMQTSEFSEAKDKIDPTNQYCWRYAPRRLEAEVIRDSMLAVSGQLDPKLYGPGTLDEAHKRRSIYFTVKRSRLIPMMTLFDSPEPLVSVGSRPATT